MGDIFLLTFPFIERRYQEYPGDPNPFAPQDFLAQE
jgi:hypothetical protein